VRKVVAVLTGALAAVSLLTACHGDFTEKASPPPVQLPGRVDNQGTLDVTATGNAELELFDDKFKPTFLKALPGERLSLVLSNPTDHEHSFTVDAAGGPDVTVRPHTKAHVDVTAPTSGFIRFYCRFHVDRGMQGAVYVDPGTPVQGAPGGVTSTTTPYPSGWGY